MKTQYLTESDQVRQAPKQYDYINQAWIVDGKYARCAHPERMDCKCYGKLHEGEEAPVDNDLFNGNVWID